MFFVLILVFVLVMYFSITARVLIMHPFKAVKYGLIDTWRYLHYHEYDRYDGGILNCYFAHFGGGKTLSITHYITALYNRYNNKHVWDRSRKKWVLQKVHVISNVSLSYIPYEPLTSLSQVVCCAYRNKQIDEKQDTRTCVLVLLDEASSQMNSRNFKTNIDADFLNALITCRHFHLSFYYTSQKFKLVDALLRSVTQTCVWCHKVWRVMIQYSFDADEMEYATNPTMVKPRIRTGFFITDKDYESYDTLATVDKLKHSVDSGDMLSEQEIIALRGNINPDNDNVLRPSRLLQRKRVKK